MARDVPQAVQSCHALLAWLIPHLDNFPRNRRFTLGERLEDRLLVVLELLVDATYRRDNAAALRQANRQIAVLRHLWRLAFELRVIPLRRYEYGARELDALGCQVGGWLKKRETR